jgi:hypothetical protein
MKPIQTILQKHKLHSKTVYLLELIPLIEMIWADGKNQQKEISILQDFTIRHLANLSNAAEGLEVISVEEANSFIDYFMKERPSDELLADLKGLAMQKLEAELSSNSREMIIEYCMDIAAACVTEYPYSSSERVQAQEKAAISELIQTLGVPRR